MAKSKIDRMYDSLERVRRLKAGYPTRDPATGKVTVRQMSGNFWSTFKPGPKRSRKSKKKVSAKEAALQRNARRKLYRER